MFYKGLPWAHPSPVGGSTEHVDKRGHEDRSSSPMQFFLKPQKKKKKLLPSADGKLLIASSYCLD